MASKVLAIPPLIHVLVQALVQLLICSSRRSMRASLRLRARPAVLIAIRLPLSCALCYIHDPGRRSPLFHMCYPLPDFAHRNYSCNYQAQIWNVLTECSWND